MPKKLDAGNRVIATKLVDQDEFHRLARARAASGVGVLRPAGRVLRAEGDGDRGISFVFSDNSVDRAGDKIFQDGWDLSEFRRNACVLWSHDSSEPPIGRVRNIRVENSTRLVGTIEFAAPQTYEFADLIFRLRAGSFPQPPLDFCRPRGDSQRTRLAPEASIF